jgi:hypothetical protein
MNLMLASLEPLERFLRCGTFVLYIDFIVLASLNLICLKGHVIQTPTMCVCVCVCFFFNIALMFILDIFS